MSKLQQRYTTKLETAKSENMGAILDAKLEATSPERVVDYVSFGLDNLDIQLERYKDYKKELDSLIKDAESQKEIIKIGTAEWLSESGIASLKGDLVSSMKVTQPKPNEEVKVTNEEALINAGYFKTTLDKTAVKNALQDGVNVEGAELEVTHKQDSITVYGKKKNATTTKEN